MQSLFVKIATKAAKTIGTPKAFIIALLIVIIWAIIGPFVKFSDTWQLVINTGTTIVTFLIVFLIQETQNRNDLMLHIKLDELIKSQKRAKNTIIDLENLTDKQLENLEKEYEKMVSAAEINHKVKNSIHSRRKKGHK